MDWLETKENYPQVPVDSPPGGLTNKKRTMDCILYLVGGIPTPLKNDGVRQLG